MKGLDAISRRCFWVVVAALALSVSLADAQDEKWTKTTTSLGQIVYVPIYSNIYAGPRGHMLDLSALLSLRNTDRNESIVFGSIAYHDTEGRKIRDYIDKPLKLGPLGSAHFRVDLLDQEGGSGAKFIVKWTSEVPVSSPSLEAVMVTTRSGLGVSFSTTGKVLEERSVK